MTNDYNDQSANGQTQGQTSYSSNFYPNATNPVENKPERTVSGVRFGPGSMTGQIPVQPGQSVPVSGASGTLGQGKQPSNGTEEQGAISGYYRYSAPTGSQPESSAPHYNAPTGSQPESPYTGQPRMNAEQPGVNPVPQTNYYASYRTEPTPAGERPTSYGYPEPEKKPEKPKKKSHAGAIVAVALICLILGGMLGCGVMWMVSRDDSTVETAVVEEADSQSIQEIGAEEAEPEETDPEETTAFESTTIEISTNSETTNMTPKDVYEHYSNAVVAISNEGTSTNIFGQVSATASTGSGMIISSDGYILTNNHVVEDADKLTVTMTSGEEYEATLIGADADNDVALIKIEGEDFPTVSIGNSDEIEVGEQVCAIGNPLGELTNTLTVGFVSALDREINENGIPINMFQTDCAINSGNSGGPIFDMNGNVIGITTAKYSSSSSYSATIEGIGFCIPINDAMSIVDDLLQYGYVKGRVSMGIACQNISSTVTQYYNLPAGVYVYAVEEGSAADQAGLKAGDIICALDGTEITTVTELKVLLKEYTPGDTATLTIYQNETHETIDTKITFDEMVSTTTSSTGTTDRSGEESQPDQQPMP